MSENEFDVVVLGTGLAESIVAAAIAKAGLKVLHLDEYPYYGDKDASLSAIELHHLVMQPRASMRDLSAPVPITEAVLRESRNYSFSLSPSITPSIGPLIDTLVRSGVARYVPFKLVDAVGLYSDTADKSSQVRLVPASKEDVFKSKELGLLQKRKLMKFLMGALSTEPQEPGKGDEEVAAEKQTFKEHLRSKQVGLDPGIADAIAYALALSTDPNEGTESAMSRLKKYIQSTGRHGNSPFIVGHFGGAGELAQGFCRACAVAGGTYILGRSFSISRTEPSESHSSPTTASALPDHPFQIKIDDVAEPLRARVVVGEQERLPHPSSSSKKEHLGPKQEEVSLARCIAVIDAPVRFKPPASLEKDANEEPETPPQDQDDDGVRDESLGDIDTAVLVFPPGALAESENHVGVVHALIAGPSAMACPYDKRIIYISTTMERQSSPEKMLQPYLTAIRRLNRAEDDPSTLNCSLFYTELLASDSESGSSCGTPQVSQDGTVPVERPSAHLAEFGDSVVRQAESAFWAVMKSLGLGGRGKQTGLAGSEPGEQELVATMWPLLVDEGLEE